MAEPSGECTSFEATITEMQTPYQAALKEDWKGIKEFYEGSEDSIKLLYPASVVKDNGLHMAVYSRRMEPLLHLIQRFLTPTGDTNKESLGFLLLPNNYGNTVLHEAAAIGNYGAVKFLVNLYPKTDNEPNNLLEAKNNNGETPLFKAAAFGSTNSVRLLANQAGQIINGKLKDVHRLRKNYKGEVESSILHVAIQGDHFGTACLLLEKDKALAELKDKNGMNSLQLLATRPSAFRSGCKMGIWKRFVYFCMPVGNDYEDDIDLVDDDVYDYEGEDDQTETDLESRVIRKTESSFIYSYGKKITVSIGRVIFRGISIRRIVFRAWPTLRKTWEEKRKHKFALRLAKALIKEDASGTQTDERKFYNEGLQEEDKKENDSVQQQKQKEDKNQDKASSSTTKGAAGEKDSKPAVDIPIQDEKSSKPPAVDIPLLLATKSGIKEIVDEILKVHPQAIEHTSPLNQNILHIAIMYRQKKIFKSVREKKMPMTRLVRVIDNHGYTILHHAADNKHVKTEGAHPGPAYQLQAEIKWFRRVHKITPSHYATYTCKIKEDKEEVDVTPEELFDRRHENQLEKAQKWIKGTSQSCSAVAVLVATVVFAAAYTLPGGSDRRGFPVFLDSPFFVVFIIMDIISLASSLTSVVMFLSILTSPFQYEDFHYSLPQKLTFGFTLLFFSVATTMLAFTATILLLIRLDPQRWTSTLVYSAAFLPVSILALTQFPMFIAFIDTLMKALKVIKKVIPFGSSLSGFKKCITFEWSLLKRKTN